MDQTTYDHNSESLQHDDMGCAILTHFAAWSPIEDVDPKQHDPAYVYVAAKAITDKMVWKAAAQYPHIDFTTSEYTNWK